MSKIIQKGIIILFVGLTAWKIHAQIPYASVKGNVGEYMLSTRRGSVKVILSSFFYSDSMTLNKNTDSFFFKQVPHGIYEIRIDANRRQTNLVDFVVEDVLIDKETVVLDTIFLFPIRSRGSKLHFWIYEYSFQEKEPKKYYSTGELFAEGNYFLVKRYSKKEKTNIYNFQKEGIWKYYYKNGSLLKYVDYHRDEYKEVVCFHENGSVKFKRTFSYNSDFKGEQLYFNLSGEIIFRIKFILNSKNNPTMIIKYEYLSGYSRNKQLVEID